jgi:hypothetical protein
MLRIRGKIVASGLLAIAIPLLANHCRAQEQPKTPEQQDKFDPKTTTRITLGSTTGAPGELVLVPIYMTPAEGVSVGTLKLQVSYVSVNLKFTKLGLGLAAEHGSVSLQTETKDSKNEKDIEEQTLTITASAASATNGIPPGLLGFITLKISENGRPATISLRASVEAEELGTKKRLESVRVVSGQIDVQTLGVQPIVTCFFFSH